MSAPTFAPPAADDFNGDLRAFLDQVPAAADYDLADMEPERPAREHRLARRAAKDRAIEQSLREGL